MFAPLRPFANRCLPMFTNSWESHHCLTNVRPSAAAPLLSSAPLPCCFACSAVLLYEPRHTWRSLRSLFRFYVQRVFFVELCSQIWKHVPLLTVFLENLNPSKNTMLQKTKTQLWTSEINMDTDRMHEKPWTTPAATNDTKKNRPQESVPT